MTSEELSAVLPSEGGKTAKRVSSGTNSASSAWKEHEEESGEGPRRTSLRSCEDESRRLTAKKTRGSFAAVRHGLTHSWWYHSVVAESIRASIKGKFFGIVMFGCLLSALFFSDVWALAGVNSNTGLNVILSVVMVVFLVEFISLSLVDAGYLLSFFFFMDIVGTGLMVLDIPFMNPEVDITMPEVQTKGSGALDNIVVTRALRTARVASRMGRLTRVVRILRYLPFLTGGHHQSYASEEEKGITSVISGQLMNMLAIRVACLTLMLVMLTPLFISDMQLVTDLSPDVFTERIAFALSVGNQQDVALQLRLMAEHFRGTTYGPYKVCVGHAYNDNTRFACDPDGVLQGLPLYFDPPPRGMSERQFFHDQLMVSFNWFASDQREAVVSMATVIFMVFIMVFSGLALSTVVNELAVLPLERMLGTVRKIAMTVFKFSGEVQEGDIDETEIDSSSEMKLLEKVVQKLAVIADLQTRDQEPHKTEDMYDEDIGILSMMQGKNIVDEKAKQTRRSTAVTGRRKTVFPVMRLEDFGVSQESYHSWSFNPLALTRSQRIQLACFTVSQFLDQGEGFLRTKEEEACLQRFVTQCEKEYLPNPFHNFAHAVDVTHAIARIMRLTGSEAFLTDLEQYALLIAAIAHDLGHPGVNNGFLSEVTHELALQYNDRSPLENMHCAKLYTIVAKNETNIFSNFTKDQYKEARKCCIETILHTDMVSHQAMVKELQMLYQINSAVFTVSALPNKRDSSASGSEGASRICAEEVEVFRGADTKSLLMDCFLHSADVSNPCRAWEVTQAWAHVCLEEFFAQGDQEKLLGIPVQFLNDREKLNRPNSQIGFIEFMIAPFFASQIRLMPALCEFGEHLATNIANWEDMWALETSPCDEERQKVLARIEKVRASLEDAKCRSEPTAA